MISLKKPNLHSDLPIPRSEVKKMFKRSLHENEAHPLNTDMLNINKIVIESISKQYNAKDLVLDNICFSIPAGHVVSLVGPTGCGKTTLLNIVGGFESATSGSVLVDGLEVTRPSPHSGYVSQEANLFPWLTVWDNVRFGARHGKGIRANWSTPAELDELAAAYLRRVGLIDAREQYPYQLSGGMKARAALGRVLLTNPSILLLDEPFAALDALTRSDMHRLLINMFRDDRERTGILITHDVEEALLLSDTIYVMSRWPAKIIDRIEVPFGWPRNYDELVQAPELARLKYRVLKVLHPIIRLT